MAAELWRLLIGPPLRACDVSREQITPVEGLSALSLDALTSVAYGPEAILVVLAAPRGPRLSCPGGDRWDAGLVHCPLSPAPLQGSEIASHGCGVS
ncbi:MAG: hypothetical protein ACRDOB_26000, partial [Streptosporangiaceae bacterium]